MFGLIKSLTGGSSVVNNHPKEENSGTQSKPWTGYALGCIGSWGKWAVNTTVDLTIGKDARKICEASVTGVHAAKEGRWTQATLKAYEVVCVGLMVATKECMKAMSPEGYAAAKIEMEMEKMK